MKNFCGKKHQPLNQRNLILVLAIAGVLLFVLSPIVYLQNKKITQNRDKILEVSKDSNLPVNIMLIKSSIGIIKRDENFSADDDWFKGLSVTVSNKSEKAITYISLRLRFPRPNKQKEDVDFVHSIESGVNPMLPNTQQIPSGELVPILPEKNVEIKLPDEDYDAIRTALRDSKFPGKIKRIQLTVSMLAFNDGTIWIGGKIYIRDKNKPGNLILLQENTIRTEMSAIPGCYNEIENLQFQYCPAIGEEPPNECQVLNVVLGGSNGNQHKYVNTEQICKTFNRRPCYPITTQRGNLWEDCPAT